MGPNEKKFRGTIPLDCKTPNTQKKGVGRGRMGLKQSTGRNTCVLVDWGEIRTVGHLIMSIIFLLDGGHYRCLVNSFYNTVIGLIVRCLYKYITNLFVSIKFSEKIFYYGPNLL
jgi:hypothetical protein